MDGPAPALALLEFTSIAVGIEAGDAMVKRSPVAMIRAGTVHPGKYLVLVAGEVADVEESVDAGRATGGGHLIDELVLPDVHPEVVDALRGGRLPATAEALGVVETATVAAVLAAADAGRKGAGVAIREVRLADGLGGKGYVLFTGPVSEVEAAVEIGAGRVQAQIVASRVIAQLHEEMDAELTGHPRFRRRVEEG